MGQSASRYPSGGSEHICACLSQKCLPPICFKNANSSNCNEWIYSNSSLAMAILHQMEQIPQLSLFSSFSLFQIKVKCGYRYLRPRVPWERQGGHQLWSRESRWSGPPPRRRHLHSQSQLKLLINCILEFQVRQFSSFSISYPNGCFCMDVKVGTK